MSLFIHPNLRSHYKTYFLTEILLKVLDDNGCPETAIYLPLMSQGLVDLGQFQTLIDMLKKAKAINIRSHFITKGKGYSKVLNLAKHGLKTIIEKSKPYAPNAPQGDTK
jgi:hypothetical protein